MTKVSKNNIMGRCRIVGKVVRSSVFSPAAKVMTIKKKSSGRYVPFFAPVLAFLGQPCSVPEVTFYG